MVVIVILGLLAALVVPDLLGKLDWAKVEITRIEVEKLDESSTRYAIMNGGRYPDELEELRTPDENGVVFCEFGQDAWDNDYAYEPPDLIERRPWIASYGKDKAPGGEGFDADITNWDED